MIFQWNSKYFDKIIRRAFIISLVFIGVIIFEYYYFNLSNEVLTLPVIIILIISIGYDYLKGYKGEHKDSLIKISNNCIIYIQPKIGYEIKIEIKDIKKITYRKFIFSSVVIDIKENQRLTLMNFLGLNNF